ncbi:MAG: sulfite exporter TauE/SafE family protein [Dehalococcoidia bacterium]|nr:sulfite exporter TauE/SafE family protein [Dehalococcoidia bacterium]
MTEVSYFVAFGGGLLSFFSPCVLPLVPAYLANLAGVTAIDPNTRRSYLPTLFHSLSFVLGFSIIFIIMGASVGLIGTTITAHSALLRQIAGGLIIAFGIFLIAAFKLPWLNYEKRLNAPTGSNPGYLRSVGIGAAFALGWTPCIGPILGAILTFAWSSQTAAQGALLLAIYSLGLGIPFIILGLVWGAIMPLWKSINRYLWAISLASGILLIIVGILMLTGNLAWLGQLVPF